MSEQTVQPIAARRGATTTVPLEFPIEVEGRTVSELHVRRPKARDLRRFDHAGGDVARSIQLTAQLCDLPPDAVEELDAADYVAVSEVVAGFFVPASRR